jgi:hypothetical protein
MTSRDFNRDWALRLAEVGIAVFPCGPDKKPLVKWRDASSTDPETVAAQWAQFPSALPGIDLGKCNLVVLDGDRHGGPDGRVALRELLLAQGAEYNGKATPGVLTPGDGAHVYFSQNGHAFGNGTGKLPKGIDVRGAGGYVIAPYTTLSDGRRYQIAKGMADLISAYKAGTVPPIPPGIAELLKKPERPQPVSSIGPVEVGERERVYAQAALAGTADELAAAQPGARNNELNAKAFRMGRFVGAGWIDRVR